MSAPASLLGHWYATGPEDKPFRKDDPDWNIHRIVEDVPGQPTVTVENAGHWVQYEQAEQVNAILLDRFV